MDRPFIQSMPLRKLAYSNILKFYHQNMKIFRLKNFYEAVITSTHNMFKAEIRKYNVYLCKPQFYYIKVGFKGVKIIRACFRDEKRNTQTHTKKKKKKTENRKGRIWRFFSMINLLIQTTNVHSRPCTCMTTLQLKDEACFRRT